DAVEMTAMQASRPPASVTNRPRITRSRTLSSAPPMMITVPSAIDPGSIRARPGPDGRVPGHARIAAADDRAARAARAPRDARVDPDIDARPGLRPGPR